MKREIPKFNTEAEEAKWWDEHLDEFEDDTAEALNSGTAQVLTRERLNERLHSNSPANAPIQLPDADLKRARDLAGAKGLDYRTYIQTLLHDALERESRKAS